MTDRRHRFKEHKEQLNTNNSSKSLERGISAPALFVDKNSPTSSLSSCDAGHDFEKKTFLKPTYCHSCTEILWGLKGQGQQCKVCGFVAHDRCTSQQTVLCRHTRNAANANPIAHQWSKMSAIKTKKKVYCNFCRKKLSSTNNGVFCEVCKTYVHDTCKGSSFNDCKDCATYGKQAKNDHHWIEGNLPAGSRCHVCGKVCATSDCLSSFRCGWCGLTWHSFCLKLAPPDLCTYRDLGDLILPPHAVNYPRHIPSQRNESSSPVDEGATSPGEGAQHVTSPMTAGTRDFGETPSTVEEEPINHAQQEEEEPERGIERQCIVMDGHQGSGSRRTYGRTIHSLSVTKETTAPAVLALALKVYGIASDPQNFYLVEVLEDEERTLENENVFDLQQDRRAIKLCIRQKKNSSFQKSLKIYNECSTSPPCIDLVVKSSSSSVAELVEQSIKAFGITEYNVADYCLVEVSQFVSSEVEERVMEDSECPLQQLEDLKEESVLASHLQRYALRCRKNQETTLYMWGVPKDTLLSEAGYTTYVKERIEQASPGLLLEGLLSMVKFGPAFPTYGGVFVEFPTMDMASKVCTALQESSVKVKLLPSIYPDQLDDHQEVLLVFINEKSGGNQGRSLLSGFRRHLNPHQVFNLAEGGPLPGLFAFRKVKRFSVLIGGGDGTFGWVLSSITDIQPHLACDNPPCALLPLGTGNDLARALKWGPGYTDEKVMDLLNGVKGAETVGFDRWEISFFDESGNQLRTAVMNNYFGIGLDAAIALDFHNAREENPDRFNSRFKNKSVFLQLGLQKMVRKTEISNITPHINIQADREPLRLPDMEGLLFLNIQSWGGGSDPWGNPHDPGFRPASYSDGLLEMVGFSGVVRMGQIQSGIRGGNRLKQAETAEIMLNTEMPVQVDGEAWLVPPGKITITKLPVQARMRVKKRRPNKDKAPPSRHHSEPSLATDITGERSPLLVRDLRRDTAVGVSSSPKNSMFDETPSLLTTSAQPEEVKDLLSPTHPEDLIHL